MSPTATLLSFASSHAAYGHTTKLFRHNCPEWLTPALIEAQGFQAVHVADLDGLPRFFYERNDTDGLSYCIQITACGEFRLLAGFQGRCCAYSQHHGAQAAFADEVRHFIAAARFAQKTLPTA